MRITRSPIEAVTVAVSTLASPNEFAGQPNAEPDFIMLAERFVAALSGDPHPSSAAILRTENDCGRGISELLQDLGEDSDAEADPEPDWKPEQQTHLSVDLVVAATRLAAMFATLPLALKAIQEHAPIVVIETGDAAINKPVCYVMTKAPLGERVTILSPGRFDRMTTPYFTDPTAVVFEGEPGLKAHDMQARDKRAIAAIQSGAIIIGVAMDSRRELAADLVRAADYRVNLPPLNADGLRFAIGVLAGARPCTSIDALISRETTIPDLRIALRGCCSADLAVERLITIVGKRLALVNKAVRVEDLDGYGEAKTIFLGIVADLIAYRAGKIPWSAVDRGLLLNGPPGTGKTTLAKAFAMSTGLPLIAASLAKWQGSRDGHLGHTLAAMQSTFAEAKSKSPCILLIDEIDAFGDRTKFSDHNENYSTQVVNGLLECLDGAEGREGVVVIGATNYAAMIDPAITRSGRLDRTVHVALPDVGALAKILRFHLNGDLRGVDLSKAAIVARGGSGADCEAWVRRARPSASIGLTNDSRSSDRCHPRRSRKASCEGSGASRRSRGGTRRRRCGLGVGGANHADRARCWRPY